MAQQINPPGDIILPPGMVTEAEEELPRIVIASQWRLMWWKFRKQRMALVSLVIILIMYFVTFFAGFFAPQATDSYQRTYTQAPPQPVNWFDNGTFAPYVYVYKQATDPKTYRRSYVIDEAKKIPLGF